MKIIRGAITIENDTTDEVNKASCYLMKEILKLNDISSDDIISITTTATRDITSAYPGPGIRMAGVDVPIICVQEQYVADSLEKCIRFVVTADISKSVSHVYVGKARSLRPDLFAEEKWLLLLMALAGQVRAR